MTKAFRIVVAIIGTAGVVTATNVGITNPLGDILIFVIIAAMIVVYLRKAADLRLVLAAFVVLLAAAFASVIYQNVPSTLYKSGLIVLMLSVLIMFGDALVHYRIFARTSDERS